MRYEIELIKWVPDLLPYTITPADKRLARNFKTFEDLIYQVIKDKAAEAKDSKTTEQNDMVSCLMANDYYKDRPDIIVSQV